MLFHTIAENFTVNSSESTAITNSMIITATPTTAIITTAATTTSNDTSIMVTTNTTTAVATTNIVISNSLTATSLSTKTYTVTFNSSATNTVISNSLTATSLSTKTYTVTFNSSATNTVISNSLTATSLSTKTYTVTFNSSATNTVISSSSTTAPMTIPTNTTMSKNLTATPSSVMKTDTSTPAASGSNAAVTVVAVIIVVLLLIAILVTILVIIFFWRKNKKNNKLNEKPPVSVTGFSISEKDTLAAKDDQELSKNNLELQNRSPDCQTKCPGEMLTQSQEQTLSVTNPDYERATKTDCSSITESSLADQRLSFENSVNSTFTESINPTAIEVCDSKNNDGLAPCTSIYADPVPLVKSKGPPVVTMDNIKQIRELGTGLFGQVILANTVGLSYQYLGIGSSVDTNISMKVAVKILKTPATAEIRRAFDKEIKFMSRLKDDNVIRLLGICTTGTSFIMMEYMENGDLNGYLQQFDFTTDTAKVPTANEITLNGLVYISYQIASGMKYLSSHKFIHRDLAARNILVGINHTVKIADFGMSQNLYSAYYCRVGGRSVLPIRWMAYECFFGKFSVKTDIWAFGITLWEIFTLCRYLPYGDFTNQQMVEDAIKGANRSIPNQPENCPDDIYCIMKSCLQHDPSKRAEFSVLCDQLNDYYTNIL